MQDKLKHGLQSLGLEFTQKTREQYLVYIALLRKWNKTYNLTAIDDPEKILVRHVLDSLSVLSFINGQRCIDIGTGAGLPGMILAIASPETNWVLLDSNQKKTCFLQHVKAELGLPHVEVINTRVESYQPNTAFSTVICRAFAPLTRILDQCQHLIDKQGQLLAMKGKQAEEEIASLPISVFNINLHKLTPTGDANLIQITSMD